LGFKSLPKDHYNLFKSITKYSFINLKDLKSYKGHFDEKQLASIRNNGKHAYFPNVKEFMKSDITIYKNPTKGTGIPQGSPISALLANIYMYSFDESICKELVEKQNVFYRRYSDDMIFVCAEHQIDVVKGFIKNAIKEIKLTISDDKTELVSFSQQRVGNKTRLQSCRIIKEKRYENFPLSYLGFEFYGYQTLLKSKNLSSFYREMKETVRRKNSRVTAIKERNLSDSAPIFKRKIYRLYSYKGSKKRKLIYFPKTETQKLKTKEYRGNFIRYALKSAEIMEAPEIKKQIRNHWKILQKTLNKYDFSN